MDREEDDIKIRWPDLTPQGRAARATYLLMLRGEMTTTELANELGTSNHGVRHIMDNLSLGGVPIYRPQLGCWAVLQEDS